MKSQKTLFLSPIIVLVAFALLFSGQPLVSTLLGAEAPTKKMTFEAGFKIETSRATAMVGTSHVKALTTKIKYAITAAYTRRLSKWGDLVLKGDVSYEKGGDRKEGEFKALLQAGIQFSR